MDMDGMSMSTTSTGCDPVNFWNWVTVGSCLLASSWNVNTKGQFAGTCIGVFCFVLIIEFLDRIKREYDRYLYRQWHWTTAGGKTEEFLPSMELVLPNPIFSFSHSPAFVYYRPSIFAQVVRTGLYLVQYIGIYIVMLIAMSYNGYVIIMIFSGGLVGYFLFSADVFKPAVCEIGTESGSPLIGGFIF
ncbi:uncharacterized protein SAPINGB_P006337 [Magnusiomyces paraingens]|uniref:Copper transport protein n=1 Tax=Magnusiomyces paraingens TaxID=2606893 RepID=A0A5E8C4F3_9ASCO|nr:uncharacterized protein SAPINGB_P006337 [Saprochaete ingens]VVT58694.1 unnamed protein product [Saprochaete ingens]